MAVLQHPGHEGTLIDVLDRVLDKGIIIDGWARMSLVGIDLMTFNGHIVVASIETYLRYSDMLGMNGRSTITSSRS
jgi:hypothetical protein